MKPITTFDDTVVVITGGTGSWGKELVQHLLARYRCREVRIVSRGEIRQVEMAFQFSQPNVRYYLGDVRDANRMEEVTRGADIVVHLAALKHVPVCEQNPQEAIATNVYGTQVVLGACVRNRVGHFVYISSDKAVEPLNIYGVTKACAEKFVIASGTDDLRVVCVRAGNVMGTNGSVIPLFLKQLATTNELLVTDPRMTRFMLPLPRAIEMVIQAVYRAQGGEVFVTPMPSMRISDLAETMAAHNGNPDTRIRVIGARPGEKFHEVLVSKLETYRTHIWDNYFVLLPHKPSGELRDTYEHLPQLEVEEYSSLTAPILTKEEIRGMLEAEGMLSVTPQPKDLTTLGRLLLGTQGAWIEQKV